MIDNYYHEDQTIVFTLLVLFSIMSLIWMFFRFNLSSKEDRAFFNMRRRLNTTVIMLREQLNRLHSIQDTFNFKVQKRKTSYSEI